MRERTRLRLVSARMAQDEVDRTSRTRIGLDGARSQIIRSLLVRRTPSYTPKKNRPERCNDPWVRQAASSLRGTALHVPFAAIVKLCHTMLIHLQHSFLIPVRLSLEVFLDELLLNLARSTLVMTEFHGKLAFALSGGTSARDGLVGPGERSRQRIPQQTDKVNLQVPAKSKHPVQ